MLARRLTGIKTSRNDGDANLVTQGVVDDGAEDDVGLVVNSLLDETGCRSHLEQPQIGATGDRHEHPMCSIDGDLEQRGGDGHLGCHPGTILARGVPNTHEGRTGIRHDGLDVGEVEVDLARRRDEVGDARDALHEHLVGDPEGVGDGDLLIGHRQQTVIGDDDEGVDLLRQTVDALVGLGRTSMTLEAERAGDHTDGESSQRTGDLGDDRGSSSTRATAFTCRHEDHVGALETLLDLLGVVLGCLSALVRIGSGTQTPSEFSPDVKFDVSIAAVEKSLRIRVDGDELDALETSFNHAIDGIAAAAAHANDSDDRGGLTCHWNLNS